MDDRLTYQLLESIDKLTDAVEALNESIGTPGYNKYLEAPVGLRNSIEELSVKIKRLTNANPITPEIYHKILQHVKEN